MKHFTTFNKHISNTIIPEYTHIAIIYLALHFTPIFSIFNTHIMLSCELSMTDRHKPKVEY